MDSMENYKQSMLRVYGNGAKEAFPRDHLADALREVTKVIDNSMISRRINSMVSAGLIRMRAKGIYEFTSEGFDLMGLPKTEKEEIKEILDAKPQEEKV